MQSGSGACWEPSRSAERIKMSKIQSPSTGRAEFLLVCLFACLQECEWVESYIESSTYRLKTVWHDCNGYINVTPDSMWVMKYSMRHRLRRCWGVEMVRPWRPIYVPLRMFIIALALLSVRKIILAARIQQVWKGQGWREIGKLEITEIIQARRFKEQIHWTRVVITEMNLMARTEDYS